MNTCEYPTHDSRKLKRFLSELKQRSEPLEMWQTHDLARGLAATLPAPFPSPALSTFSVPLAIRAFAIKHCPLQHCPFHSTPPPPPALPFAHPSPATHYPLAITHYPLALPLPYYLTWI